MFLGHLQWAAAPSVPQRHDKLERLQSRISLAGKPWFNSPDAKKPKQVSFAEPANMDSINVRKYETATKDRSAANMSLLDSIVVTQEPVKLEPARLELVKLEPEGLDALVISIEEQYK